MIYKDNDNKVYSAIKVDEDTIQSMIDDCIAVKSQASPLKKDELSVRRKIKMRKNIKSIDLCKKVAVASLSLAATGAIIAGVVAYNNGGTKDVAKNMEKTIVETSTESINETDKNNIDTSNIKVDKNEDLNYKLIFETTKDDLINDKKYEETGEVEVGNYIFKAHDVELDESEWTDETVGVTVRKKGEDKDYTIPRLDKVTFQAYTYTNGKYLYYCRNNSLYKYNLETNESDNIVMTTSDSSAIEIENIYDGKIIIDLSEDMVYKDTMCLDYKGCICSYDVKTGTVKKMEKREFSEVIDGGYIIAFEKTNLGDVDEYGISTNVYEACVEKITNKEFEEIGKLGKHSTYFGKSEAGDKLYFTVYGEGKDGYENSNDLTIKAFDLKTSHINKLCEITSKDLGYPNEDIFIVDVNDEYCKVKVTADDGKVVKFKYTYATGKLEKLSKKK